MTTETAYHKQYYEENKDKIKARARDYYWRNRQKIRDAQRAKAKDPEVQRKARAYQLKRKFDLDATEYERLLGLQEGRCAICGENETGRKDRFVFSVDHDHKTGKIRGLLCRGCNTGIGNLRDDPEILLRAAEYLRKNSS